METDDGSTTNEDTDEPTVDVVSDATDNESQISGKVLIYKSRGELSLLVQSTIQCVFLVYFDPKKYTDRVLQQNCRIFQYSSN